MSCKTPQETRFQWVVDLRRLVTHRAGKRSCDGSNPDWPGATAGRARSWRVRGSSFGFPAWPASGPVWQLWTPCGRRLWRSIADASDCGHRGGTFHCNTGTCGRRRNSSAGAKCTAFKPQPDSVRTSSPSPAPPRRRTKRRRRKKSFVRSSRIRTNASVIRRSNRPNHPAFRTPPAQGSGARMGPPEARRSRGFLWATFRSWFSSLSGRLGKSGVGPVELSQGMA